MASPSPFNDGSLLSTNPSWPSLYNPRSELFDIEHHDPIQPGGFYLVDPQDVFRFTLYWTLVFYIPVFVVFGLYAFFNLTFPPSKKQKVSRLLGGFHDSDEDGEDEGAEDIYPISRTSIYAHPRYTTREGYCDTLPSEITTTAIVASPLQPYPRSPISATANHPFLATSPPSAVHAYPPPSQSPAITPLAGKTKTVASKNLRKQNKPKNAARSRITFALLVLFGFLLLSLVGAVVSSAIVGYILTGLYKAGKFYMSTWVPFLWAAISVMVGMLNVWPSVINLV